MDFSFNVPSVFEKLDRLQCDIDLVMGLKSPMAVPHSPAREVSVLAPKKHPPKKGLSYPEGRARLLHDLASIELQAMELGLRTLAEFPEAPAGFREELALVTLSEGQHLRMCLESIEDEGFSWGDFPVHTALWDATSSSDSLLDRILIVHRYLEGSGLDAGAYFLQRLESVSQPLIKKVVKQINDEEVGHVEFGSRWYREVCRIEGIDPQDDFIVRLSGLVQKIPKRVENVHHELRKKAGFSESEIRYLERLRLWFLIPLAERKGMSFQEFAHLSESEAAILLKSHRH